MRSCELAEASASEMTSAYFASRSNRFCSWVRAITVAARLGDDERAEAVLQRVERASARTQPLVEKPTTYVVSMPRARSVEASEVPKNAEAYCLATTSSPGCGAGASGKAA